MNLKLIVLYLIILNPNLELWCQNRIDIIIPTVKQETEYVWRNIQDIEFFEKHNYDLVLPQAELIDSLKAKSRSNRLTQNDFDGFSGLDGADDAAQYAQHSTFCTRRNHSGWWGFGV